MQIKDFFESIPHAIYVLFSGDFFDIALISFSYKIIKKKGLQVYTCKPFFII